MRVGRSTGRRMTDEVRPFRSRRRVVCILHRRHAGASEAAGPGPDAVEPEAEAEDDEHAAGARPQKKKLKRLSVIKKNV